MTRQRFPKITAEALDDLRGRIGQAVEDDAYVRVATRDAIRNFALGIGDPNPLWLDEGYARQTDHGCLLAPPSFLYATSRVVGGYVGGLPGIHAMFAGTNWRWFRPIRVDDAITSEALLKDVILKRSEFSGQAVEPSTSVNKMVRKSPAAGGSRLRSGFGLQLLKGVLCLEIADPPISTDFARCRLCLVGDPELRHGVADFIA